MGMIKFKSKALILLVILALAIIPPFVALKASAWGVDHPDECKYCHLPGSGSSINTVSDAAGNVWNHDILKGPSVWAQCTNCHTGVGNAIQNSVHAPVGCQCHAVVHVGYGNFTAGFEDFFGAIFYRVPSVVDVIAPPVSGNTVALTTKNVTFTENNYGALGLSTTLLQGTGDGMEIEVGLYDAYKKKFIDVGSTSRGGLGTITATFDLCFNCHFVAINPSQVGSYAVVGGKWKIGIPESALSLPPHEIYSVQPTTTGGGVETTTGVPVSLIVVVAFAAIVAVIVGYKIRGA
ncbi:MAG: hypothetical protein F7B95_01155 [Desulfurococcales archaeon]|nr:hypothetical protein [Desulfurococcales archaeon]